MANGQGVYGTPFSNDEIMFVVNLAVFVWLAFILNISLSTLRILLKELVCLLTALHTEHIYFLLSCFCRQNIMMSSVFLKKKIMFVVNLAVLLILLFSALCIL